LATFVFDVFGAVVGVGVASGAGVAGALCDVSVVEFADVPAPVLCFDGAFFFAGVVALALGSADGSALGVAL